MSQEEWDKEMEHHSFITADHRRRRITAIDATKAASTTEACLSLESVACGAPVVAVPQWSDQDTNACLVVEWGIGVRTAIDTRQGAHEVRGNGHG
jgi:hypothetical protein